MADESVHTPALGGLAPLLIFFAVLLFAALGWCMISSCLGKSMRESVSDLWDAFVLSARSGGAVHQAKQRRDWGGDSEYELDFRGRGHGRMT